VKEPRYPLLASEDPTRFKLFLCDIGLLTCQSEMDVVRDTLLGRPDVNFGAFYENVVAQELVAHGHGSSEGSLCYYKSHALGELDFVIQQGTEVLPIEVKSGKSYYRRSALNNVMKTENFGISRAIVLCEGNVETSGGVAYLPVYMAMYL
jgi:predicted AAA+ superfamily ATPase